MFQQIINLPEIIVEKKFDIVFKNSTFRISSGF